MLVEIRNSSIELGIPGGTGTAAEQYIIERDKPFDPAVFGLAHRYPGVLSKIIDQLTSQAEGLDNGNRGFVNHVAANLNAARLAIGNSEEL